MMWSVNRELLPMKAHYFLFNGGLASILSFLPLYARQLGLSSVVLGTVYTILPIMGILAKPIFGALADRFQIQKTIFLACLFIMTVSYFLIQFIPDAPTEKSATLICDTLAYFRTCKNDLDTCHADAVMLEPGTGRPTVCEAVCNMSADSKFWYEVCSSWNVTSFCNSTSSVLRFESEISTQSLLYDKSCLHFPVHTVTIDGNKYVPACSDFTAVNCSLSCNTKTINQLLESSAVDKQLSHFWMLFVLLVSSFIARAVATSVGDAICFQLLGNKPEEYGKQRLWGAVGWGTASVIAGILVDSFSDGTAQKNFTAIFYVMIVLMSLDITISSTLECKEEISKNIWKNIGKVMSEARMIIFIAWCTFVGITMGVLWLFLFWHIEDMIPSGDCQIQHWLKTLEGLILGVRCFGGELPFFFFSSHILKKIGHLHTMSLILFAISVRCFLYSILENPWWCLPLELLQGVTCGLCFSVMASYTSILAPPGTEATMQGIVGAIFEGVGVSLGSLLGGVLYDMHGGAWTFQVLAAGSFVAFILHVLIQYILKKSSHNDSSHSFGYASPQESLKKLDFIEHKI